MATSWLVVIAVLLACGGESSRRAPSQPGEVAVATDADRPSGFLTARGSRDWRFPRDHGAHSAFATEWWYTTGSLRTPEGRRFGYELTFFRVGLVPPEAAPRPMLAAASGAAVRPTLATERPTPASAPGVSPWRVRDVILAHLAVTDVEGRRFLFDHRESRAAQGWAGADTTGLDVWVGDWRMRRTAEAFRLEVPATSTAGRIGLDLSLSSSRPPVLHGAGGLSRKDARAEPHATWYVSLPRLETAGTLTLGGETFPVAGTIWLDHEFFSGGLSSSQVGWDWFAIRLEDGRDVMVYRLRGRDGDTDYASGTVTAADGASWRPLDTAGAVFEPLAHWRSPESGAAYPVAWRLRLPAEELELESRTPVPGQEVRAGGRAFTYWEGLVDYAGRWDGRPVAGEGYVELTGYDAALVLP